MASPELTIITFNIIIVLAAYFVFYPKIAGSDGSKIATYDALFSILALTIAGFLYRGSGQEFNAIFTELNWFWFTLLTYIVVEIPLMLWYYKKHGVWKSMEELASGSSKKNKK